MNILLCSAGRRVELVKEFKKSIKGGKVVVTDVSATAPAIYVADKYYNAGLIYDKNYIDNLLEICRKEKIDAVTTLIDPEIAILARNRDRFEMEGVLMLAPYPMTADLCFDKSKLIDYLSEKGLRTVKTWKSMEELRESFGENIPFPIFVKPRTGSGSVGARKIDCLEQLKREWKNDPDLIAQEYMGDAVDLDADVYVDAVSKKPVAIFSKKKLETKIGGASKTVSFKDKELVNIIESITSELKFCGPIDMDFFYKEGKYYLSEINPRFGGAYIHAYECGVDFIELIENNARGVENKYREQGYEDGLVMMMYDSLVVKQIGTYEEILRGGYHLRSNILVYRNTVTARLEKRRAA